MGRITKLRDLIGVIKDKASQSKAALLSKLQLALLCATTHDPSAPPAEKHISAFLSFGHSSRATAAPAIKALMDRLQETRDSAVALKCLAIIHDIIKHGSFILQDQLCVYASTNGRNYLKLSGFRDNSTSLKWDLSSWVRWYARYLDTLLATSRVLGFFLCSSSGTLDKDKAEEKVSSHMNSHLLKEFDSLVKLLEEMCNRPFFLNLHGNKLVNEIMFLVSEDYVSALNEIMLRANEFKERLSCQSFVESVELMCYLQRLEDCKERLSGITARKKALIESFWASISEIKCMLGKQEISEKEGRLLITTGKRGAESARFTGRVKGLGDSVQFTSSRYSLTGLSVLEFAH